MFKYISTDSELQLQLQKTVAATANTAANSKATRNEHSVAPLCF